MTTYFCIDQLFFASQSPCESSPCQDGGTCRPLYDKNDMVCDCSDGRNGTHCEKGNDLDVIFSHHPIECDSLFARTLFQGSAKCNGWLRNLPFSNKCITLITPMQWNIIPENLISYKKQSLRGVGDRFPYPFIYFYS